MSSLSESISNTLKKVKGTLIGLQVPDNAPKQKRAKKENRRKSNSRKKERAEAAAEDLVSLITCRKEHFVPGLLLADTDIVYIEKNDGAPYQKNQAWSPQVNRG